MVDGSNKQICSLKRPVVPSYVIILSNSTYITHFWGKSLNTVSFDPNYNLLFYT